MIIGRNYYESQKLYSTGDYELDELLEKAFCEGYEYAQREFNMSVGATLKNNVRLTQKTVKGTKYAGKSMASLSRLITPNNVKNLGLSKEQLLKMGKEAIADANLSGMNGRKFAHRIQPGQVKMMQAGLI